VFPYLEHVAHIADAESEPPPPPLLWLDIYTSSGATQCDYVAEPRKRDAQVFIQTNLQKDRDYPFATREEYKNIPCGIETKGM
jgi:hypothetical protein